MKILELLTEKRRLGNLGESAAASYLRKNGYRIIKRNYVAHGHEIDIVARKHDVTAFIEVKARSTKSLGRFEARPACAVTPEKQRKILKCAAYYKVCSRDEVGKMRFDVIEVYIKDGKAESIKHLEGAFDYNTAYK